MKKYLKIMSLSYVFLLSPWHCVYAEHHVEMPADPDSRPYKEPNTTKYPHDDPARPYRGWNDDRSNGWFSSPNSNGYRAPSYGGYDAAPSYGGYGSAPSYGGYGPAPSGSTYSAPSNGR